MQLGILGGSFNPPHLGHLCMALCMRHALALEAVDVVPAFNPPHKGPKGMLPYDLRSRLVRAAFQGVEGARVVEAEAERGGPSYTVDTLRAYRERLPEAELWFLLSDADLVTLPHWHEGRRLTDYVRLAVADRVGVDVSRLETVLRDFLGLSPDPRGFWADAAGHERARLLALGCPNVSGTALREAWRHNGDWRAMVPESVAAILDREARTLGACWGDGSTDLHLLQASVME